MRPTRMVGLTALVAALATGCGGSSGTTAHASAPPVSQKQAVAVLDRLMAAAPGESAQAFCANTYQTKTCEDTWKQAAELCLEPGVAPHIIDSAVVENTDTMDGGRVLKVEGKTASGQRYVSQVFVTAATGTPQASVGVYWSGLGLGDSPFGENKTAVPQSECGRK
ncbi:hypothetical protein ACFVXW_26475 [Streptomyces sp. NPDC058251]|uniref:hypothetical protein n=1 Tax=unclassified Streptomyces TaxID=2593676 RepID=UPI003665C636